MTKPELKIIADHLRSSCFLIADGVLPSNEGRGYVLRRIMRRAMRQIHKLGTKEVTMYQLVGALIKEMGKAYPELGRAENIIVETLKNEEKSFRETLDKGLKILEKEILTNKSAKFSGATAFKLYDTYGFPLDLTQDILKEKAIEVDVSEFNSEMAEQKKRAKANWAGSGEETEDNVFFDLKEKHGETEFLGYETLNSSAKILAIEELSNNKQKIIILDKTPFYATSGGQKGDDGFLSIGDNVVHISEAKKCAGNLFIHLAKNMNGDLKVGHEVEARVNPETRQLRSKNHSATHLMHKALKQVIGDSISQKGSNVEAKYFTFDFNFNRAMTIEEIEKTEALVNRWIQQASTVNTNLMPIEKARETGAEALFGEKYDDEVRVVAMGESVELCGGTHVSNTSEIEIFKIISEKSVASGIRRIEARSAAGAKEYLLEQEEKLQHLIADLKERITQKDQEIAALKGIEYVVSDIEGNNQAILEESLKKKTKEVEQLKKQQLLSNLDDIQIEKIGDLNFLYDSFENIDAKDVREIVNALKAKNDFQDSTIFAIFGCYNGKVSVCIAISANLIDRFDSAHLVKLAVSAVGGKGGGGKKDLAMGGGNDKTGIAQAIQTLKETLT